MKSKGYSIIELIAIMIIVGVVMVIVFVNTSYAFVDNKEEYYENKINTILTRAKAYGETSSILQTEKMQMITVNDLVENDLLEADKDGLVIDPRNENNDLNNTEIIIKLNENNEIITYINE